METGINYLPIFLVMLIAWLVPVAMANIRVVKIPPVIVEIILGFIIGQNMLNILPDTQYMDFLALSGFLFLLFMSGLEIDVHHIRSSLPKNDFRIGVLLENPLIASIFIYFLSLGLSFVATLILSYFVVIDDIVFLTIVIPTVALSMVAPVLKDRGDIGKKHGQVIMLVGAIATIMSIILISFYSGLLKNGISFELLLFLVIFATFFIAVFAGKYLLKLKLLQNILYQLEHAASQIKVRGTIALMLGFVTVAYVIKVELVLGAFLTGILLSIFLAKERSSLIMKLDGMSYGFFVPIFFIMVGANLELSALKQFDNSYLFLTFLILIFFAVQILPTLIMAKNFKFKTALSSGILLTSRLGLTIASAQIGMQLGVISPALNAAIVIVAIISSIIAPVVYTQLQPKSLFTTEKIIIVGGSRTGMYLAERLRLHGKEVVVVEVNRIKYMEIKQKGFKAVLGSGFDQELYNKIDLQPYNFVVVLTGSEQRNVMISEMLKLQFQHEKIITDVVKDEYLRHLENLQIADLDVRRILASAIENMIFRPDTYQHLFENFGQYAVQDILISNIQVDGKLIREIPFHREGSLMLINRNGSTLIPRGNTPLLLGDIVTVIGMESAINDFRKKLE